MPVKKRTPHPNNEDPTYRGRGSGKAAKTSEGATPSGSSDSADPPDAAAVARESLTKAFANITDSYICPISLSLPIEPVRAMDGKVYEKEAILEHFKRTEGNRVKSPFTNEDMDKTLKPAPEYVALFENMIPEGHWNCERAWEWLEKWNKIKDDEKHVKSLKIRAEAGNAQSMFELGNAYRDAKFRLAKDPVMAHEWYQKAADLSHPTACTNMGLAHNDGRAGVPTNLTLAAGYFLAAAMLGSEAGCYEVGELYYHGRNCYPVDEEKAKMWYSKMEHAAKKDAAGYRREKAKMRLESIGVGDDDDDEL